MAYENDIYTRNGDSELAVRVVTATERANTSSYDDVFTRDTNGKLAVRVVGAGGGDSHNLGWFATPQALSEAYPTGESGDYAIVGSTDTVWVWDSDTNAWKDTDTKGQVESVNGQTGIVSLGAADVGAQPTLVSGTNIKTVDGNSLLGSGNLELSTYLTYPNGWTTNSTTKAFCDDIAADETAVKGKAYLGEVTCSDLPAGVSNAEVVVEIMDGTTAQDKVIVLSLKSGNVAPYAWQYVYWDNGTNVSGWKTWQETLVSGTNIKTVNGTSLLGSGDLTVSGLPTQTGQSGKFLTTDGTDASWGTTVQDDTLNVKRNTGSSNMNHYIRLYNSYGAGNNYTAIACRGGYELSISNYINGSMASTGVVSSQIFRKNNTSTPDSLGDSTHIWSRTYTEKINNGNDITVPTVAGSMAVQVATMPTADSTLEGQIYQFVGATDSTYTNGRFYKCVSDGQATPTYSWEEVSMGGSSLPDPTGKSGRYLTNDGTNISWSAKAPLVNNATSVQTIAIGNGSSANTYGVSLGDTAVAGTESIAIGFWAKCNAQNGVSIGEGTNVTARYGIQLGGINSVNNEQATLKVGFGLNDNYKLLDSDGTIPADRLVHSINKYSTMPTAASTNEGWIVQFTGTTDSTYTHGHLYECVSDGADPATYSWTEVQLGGGGSSYTAGTGIDITGGVISVTSPTLTNTATASSALTIGGTPAIKMGSINIGSATTSVSNYSVAIGTYANISTGSGAGIALGYQTKLQNGGQIAIGGSAEATASNAIQLGSTGTVTTNSDANTLKVANANGNFEMMSADGTIPTARLTKVNTTVTLAVADWSSNTQTVNVTGMTATGVVMVSPDPTDQADYTSAGILCTAQAAGTLTFTCDTVPSGDIDVNVVCL